MAIRALDHILFLGHEDAELPLAVVGRIHQHDFAAKGAPGQTGPADQLQCGPPFELEAYWAAFPQNLPLGADLSGGDQGHVLPLEPDFHHGLVGLGDDGAERRSGTEERTFRGLKTEDDAGPGRGDLLHPSLADLDLQPRQRLLRRGQFGPRRIPLGGDALNGGPQIHRSPLQLCLGSLQLCLGPVPFQGGQFKVPLGHKSAFVGVERFEPVELKARRIGGKTGGRQASLGSLHRQRERPLLLANLEAQGFDPSLGGIAPSAGRIALLQNVGQEVGIVVHDLEKRIALSDRLALDHEGPLHLARQRRLDGQAPFQRVVGNDSTGSADELPPRQQDE